MLGAIFDFRFNICCRIRYFKTNVWVSGFLQRPKKSPLHVAIASKNEKIMQKKEKTVSKFLKKFFFFFDKFGIVWSEAFLRKFWRNCFSFFEFARKHFLFVLENTRWKKELSSFSGKISDPCYLISRWTALGNVHRYSAVFLSLRRLVVFYSPHEVSKCMWNQKLQFLTLVC